MKAKTIEPFDWHRIFIGDLPWAFTGEIVFRTLFIYCVALLMIKLVARRVEGQLSLIELLLIIALGSAVGDPMFYPEVPLLHGTFVIATIILLTRVIIKFVNVSEFFETTLQGVPHLLVEKGVIQLDALEKAKLSQERLFEVLRLEGIRNLGQVEYVFHEQSGDVSVFRYSCAQSGLPIVPPWDLQPPEEVDPATSEYQNSASALCCRRCGRMIEEFENSQLCCQGKRPQPVKAEKIGES